jgi:hypothetical protein
MSPTKDRGPAPPKHEAAMLGLNTKLSHVTDKDMQHVNIHDNLIPLFLTKYRKWGEIVGAMVLDEPQLKAAHFKIANTVTLLPPPPRPRPRCPT